MLTNTPVFITPRSHSMHKQPSVNDKTHHGKREHAQIRLASHFWVLFLALFISMCPICCIGVWPNFIPAACALRPLPSLRPNAYNPAIMLPHCTPAFSPQSKAELQSVIDACLNLSPNGDCSDSPHGPTGEWDVSSITDMTRVFSDANDYNADIFKWDVSSVTDMSFMFSYARSHLMATSRRGTCHA